MAKMLLKDIIIPKGTVFQKAPIKTKRFGDGHFCAIIELTDNTYGEFEYCMDECDEAELSDYFMDLDE